MSVDVSTVQVPPTTITAMPSEEDQRLHNVGVAALAAVAQYPHAVNQESGSLTVSEVVNAMSGGTTSPGLGHFDMQSPGEESLLSDWPRLAYPPETETTPGETGLFSPHPSGSDVSDFNPTSTVQELILRTAHQNIVTLDNDSDINDNSPRDMIVDYESVFEDHTSPSTNPDDDLEGFAQFYPGEMEYYHQRSDRALARRASIGEIDLDEFYDRVHYAALSGEPQPPGTPPMGPFPIGDGLIEPGLHPESIIHTTSTGLHLLKSSKC